MLRHVAALGCLLLVACSHPARVASAPVIVEPKPVAVVPATAVTPAPVDAIVLVGKASLDLAADGTEVGSLNAFRVAAGRRVLTVEQDEAKGTYACDVDLGGGDPFHIDGEFYSQSLMLIAPAGPILTIVPAIEREEEPNVMADDKMSSAVEAIIGPYVFVKTEHTFFGCGAAHPLYGVGNEVWNAKTGQEITLTVPDGVGDRARAALKDRGFEEEPHVAEALPSLDPQGRLTVKWRFEKSAAYAESDGLGSAYTISTVVESDVLPPELEAFREPPPAVLAWLKTHPTPIRGWTRVD